ncbi:DUF1365 domain-containing protein [Streptomonospora litoralis]|uniref:DUF1365 domain-containing protein n=1 Tax=Streptomonospora litoralis TaxID=2498135 RepID=A0A4P6PY97_9ACTN|nr:DUF1365 domain-containing protein [Streptomonospora litoralis]QBI53093.1 hypothetical protein EKD16_06475 [Streptomonospora litoralis]
MSSGPAAPALYEATVRHARAEPVRNVFAYRGYYWLVDLDDLPVLPRVLRPLARFRVADHCGDPRGTLRGNVDAFAADHGIDLTGGRVVMLAHARVLGHVFNPITVYWCRAADGTAACVIAEVHNTYRQRHRYLLRTDEGGRAEVPKEFYVSPFNAVDGTYRLSLPEPGRRLDLAVSLHREGRPPFTASLHGRRRPATAGSLLRLALRHPMTPLLGALRIRWQGVRLLARGLRMQPRPPGRAGPAADRIDRHTTAPEPRTPQNAEDRR